MYITSSCADADSGTWPARIQFDAGSLSRPFRRQPMKFIVEAQKEEKQDKWHCPLNHTMCALCSEDPRFCDLLI